MMHKPTQPSYVEQDLAHNPGTYAIYQLPPGEAYRNYHFTGLDRLGKMELAPLTRKDYNLVYMGTSMENNKEKLLNQLYETFNINHPADFYGHSLSVSDVIATNLGGEISYHFVDSVGFQKFPFENTLLPEKENPITQLVDLAKNDLEGLVNALSSYENRTAVETALNISQLKSQLEKPLPFPQLCTLNDYCRDTWLKVDGLDFETIQDFMVEAVNNHIVTPEQILTLPYRVFGGEVIDGDVESLQQFFGPQVPMEHISVEGHMGTWYVVDTEEIDGKDYRLLEHEEHGDMAACVIIDNDGKLVLDDVWNGFDDLKETMAAERAEKKLSVLERLQVKPEPRKSPPQKPKEVER